jgi:ABC-type iron transport system FetAB ATPase subunit
MRKPIIITGPAGCGKTTFIDDVLIPIFENCGIDYFRDSANRSTPEIPLRIPYTMKKYNVAIIDECTCDQILLTWDRMWNHAQKTTCIFLTNERIPDEFNELNAYVIISFWE